MSIQKPLHGRAVWKRLVEQHQEQMAEQGGTRDGYIAHHHFRLGKSQQTAVAKFEADSTLLAAYKRRMAEGRPRLTHIVHANHSIQQVQDDRQAAA